MTKLIKDQKIKFCKMNVAVDGEIYRKVIATVRFDDQCGNGHNTLSVTGEAWSNEDFKEPSSSGCIHEILLIAFPELKDAINMITLYKSGQMYINKRNNKNLSKINDKEELNLKKFTDNLNAGFTVEKENCEFSLSEGKEIDIEGARRCAMWPDATVDQLQNKELLESRLPIIKERLKKVVNDLNLEY